MQMLQKKDLFNEMIWLYKEDRLRISQSHQAGRPMSEQNIKSSIDKCYINNAEIINEWRGVQPIEYRRDDNSITVLRRIHVQYIHM